MSRVPFARTTPLLAALPLLAATASTGLALSPVPAEEAAPLVVYSSNSGSLPPRYAWSLTARIAADGTLQAEYCTGYGPPDGACRAASATLPAATLAAILQAARASDLARHPAHDLSPPPVGGPSRSGLVQLEEGEVRLPAFPAPEAAARVEAVLNLLAEVVAGAVSFESDDPAE